MEGNTNKKLETQAPLQWKPSKPGEFQFEFFEDQELRQTAPVNLGGKRTHDHPPNTSGDAKRVKK